jgi:SPP1 gp7 family putative phage head morphogenesis protein
VKFPLSPKIVARLLVLVAKQNRWREVQLVADRHQERTKQVALSAIDSARKALLKSGLKKALKAKDHAATLEAASKAVDVLASALLPGLETALHEVMSASGTIAARSLKWKLRSMHAAGGFRTAVITKWDYNSTDPHAVAWIKDHAAKTIDGISEDTRQQIRDLVEEAFSSEFDVNDLADEIANIVGDDARADVIARTETMRASNEGQLEAWDQAKDAGLLTGNEQKEWIVTPDDRLCPICEPMEGVTVGLDENFDVDGDEIDAPPAHPNCRCTVGLAV